MLLEEIGFYTLSDSRAKNATHNTQIQRLEVILTDRCNFRCVYCRGIQDIARGDLDIDKLIRYIHLIKPLNIRFTGGEPMMYDFDNLLRAISSSVSVGTQRIALSTNGSAGLDRYKTLIDYGVNDFSISLDGCCSSTGDYMAGSINGSWDIVTQNIKELSKLTYVSVGMVFNEQNINECVDAVKFADSLGIHDIRVIPSAQYNKALSKLKELPKDILKKYKILNYRINNINNGKHVRGLLNTDASKCPLVLDDIMIAGNYHYACPIHFRERGKPIGKVDDSIRLQRLDWYENHDCMNDIICKENCLDVCIDYNNKWVNYHNNGGTKCQQ